MNVTKSCSGRFSEFVYILALKEEKGAESICLLLKFCFLTAKEIAYTSAKIDGTPFGAPVEAGMGVGIGGSNEQDEQFVGYQDFVLAYRLLRIKPKKDTAFKEQDYNKFALLSEEDGSGDGEVLRQAVESFRNDWEVEELTGPTAELEGLELLEAQAADLGENDCNILAWRQ
jgi:hypothetical protein